MLYMLTRMGNAKDWGSGLPLKANLLGKMNKLEVHHIFPKAQLYKMNFNKAEVNALANFCFLTKNTNLNIRDRKPEEYFTEIERTHPGALASQWIPMDPELWKLENYGRFLEARKQLLAEASNKLMGELLHGESQWLTGPVVMPKPQLMNIGIESEEEEESLRKLNAWVMDNGLTPGVISHEFIDPVKGDQYAIFDIAWPNGLQENLSQPVAVLLNEGAEILALANKADYRCFTSVDSFKEYVETEILNEVEFEQLRIENS